MAEYINEEELLPDEEAIGQDEIIDTAIEGVDQIISDQQAAIDKYAEDQKNIQEDSLALTEQKINQEKLNAEQDYHKEQKAAYADWQKQSDPYGVNAERMASAGLTGSGYSESSQVRMYTAYQNRVALAKQSYDRIVADYNIAMSTAQMQNNAVMAEIAYNSMVSKMELALQGLTTKTNLLLQKVQDMGGIIGSLKGDGNTTESTNGTPGGNGFLDFFAGSSSDTTKTDTSKKTENEYSFFPWDNNGSTGLDPFSQKMTVTNPYAVTNKHNKKGVYIDGYRGPDGTSFITWENLVEMMRTGLIKETKDKDGVLTYTYKGK